MPSSGPDSGHEHTALSSRRRLAFLDRWVARIPFFQVLPGSVAGDRVSSVDYFRGYTIIAMYTVNYLGGFEVMPWQFKHHETLMSFADTVMINFLFAVGMGSSLSFRRYSAQHGLWRARWKATRRNLILIGLVLILSPPDVHGQNPWVAFKGYIRYPFWDALAHIACAGLLCIPFIERSIAVRAGMAAVYGAFYQIAYSALGYGPWVMANSMDGGWLGTLSWTVPLLMGSIVADWRHALPSRGFVTRALLLGGALSLLGLVLRLFWPFSQRGMTSSYAVFATGLAVLTYLGFFLLADTVRVRIPPFSTFGKNPLLLYLLQDVLYTWIGGRLPGNARFEQPLVAFFLIFLAAYAVAKILEMRGYWFRV